MPGSLSDLGPGADGGCRDPTAGTRASAHQRRPDEPRGSLKLPEEPEDEPAEGEGEGCVSVKAHCGHPQPREEEGDREEHLPREGLSLSAREGL